METISNLLIEFGTPENLSGYFAGGILVLIIFLACVIANIITKKVILRILAHYIKNNKFNWDNVLLERQVFQRLAHLIPAIIIYNSAPAFGEAKIMIQRFTFTYVLVVTIFVLDSVLNSINDIYSTFAKKSKAKPIKGLLQVIKIIAYLFIGILIVANLMGESPIYFLSGLGALTAIVSLVFKDSILGFVAGIQLASNDMLRIGDWVEMPKYGADGDVIDISLNTVKVQNWDKTIVTIPAYAFISDSFKNWRGMVEAGGRRIKRSIYIDMTSIKFCSEEMIAKYKKIDYLTDYITQKEEEIKQYNLTHKINPESKVNGRHLTNIGTFRAYIKNYLKNHPRLHQDMIQMVRQLPPEDNGLPLEIYVFTNDTRWVSYEEIQADIFDHILAVAEEFDLRVFQNPTGYDLRQINLSIPKNE